jgi:CheY-like chemotaxis protein
LVRFEADVAGLTKALQAVDSGAEAIEYLQGHGPYADRDKFPLPHILLLDLRMPRVNGFDLLQWVRSQPHLAGVVVILLTASAHPEDIKRGWQLGANAFVQKPTTLTELIRFLESLKAFWAAFHEFPSAERPHPADLKRPALTP